MYVRKIDDNKFTHVRKEFKNFLIKKKTFKEIKQKNIFFSIMKLKKVFDYMINDLKNKKKFIVTKKIMFKNNLFKNNKSIALIDASKNETLPIVK